MAAYTSVAAIESRLQTQLSPPQAAEATVAADAITAWIDRRTGRTWQAASPVTDELSTIVGGLVYLANSPVLTVSAVGVRSRTPNDPLIVLDADDWELFDAAHGVVLLAPAGPYPCALASVSYTHDATSPPADIGYAATSLAVGMLYTTLHPESHGLKRLSLAESNITLEYADASAGIEGAASNPFATAVAVVDSYRRPVIA